ncbi:MAG: hypothetical protein ACJA08_001618 [Cyclobacteriaceae bacterium]|jgi:hypothetical protein
MILIFIGKDDFGTKLIKALNAQNFKNLTFVQNDIRHTATAELEFSEVIKSDHVNQWILENSEELEFVFDLRENLRQSKLLWSLGSTYQIPIGFLNTMSDFPIWTARQQDSPFYWAIFDSGEQRFSADEMIIDMLERKDSGLKKK